MATPDLPIPSDRLQDSLDIFTAHLKAGKLDGTNPPEWAMMAAALECGFTLLEKQQKLHLMFDTSNPFDLALLAWCNEAKLRQERKANLTSRSNPSLN